MDLEFERLRDSMLKDVHLVYQRLRLWSVTERTENNALLRTIKSCFLCWHGTIGKITTAQAGKQCYHVQKDVHDLMAQSEPQGERATS